MVTLAGFRRGSGIGAISASEVEPVSKTESCVGEDLLTLTILPFGEACEYAELSTREGLSVAGVLKAKLSAPQKANMINKAPSAPMHEAE